MLKTALIILFAILFFLSLTALLLYRRQVRGLAQQLKDLEPGSNQRLTCSVRDRNILSLCRLVNTYIDSQQKLVLQAREAEEKLKYTIASVSHDIRTPLTGASGYMQMAEKTEDPDKRKEYCRIVRGRLKDLEQLLDQLFLYTKLTSQEISLQMELVSLFPLVCEVLTGFYGKFQEQNREPSLDFQEEAIQIQGDSSQLKRVLGNLVSNSLSYGLGTLFIFQKGNTLTFSNKVKDPGSIDPDQMFVRFYRGDPSRNASKSSHAGLGLSIARELTQAMGGKIEARLHEDILEIVLTFQGISR
ncbi:sensor histidine kinase [Blautia sp. An81]|uniref:sensor histidine kinase n=1 Tax=Blautia sp. An81 TaxID=1965659 RepID=UPI00130406CB|nr:HAMP domain-containing sensor histidine kinase [Blautia sp. An81]